jgi:hypothetical protein
MTLKRSKSVRPFLLSICSRFFAQLLDAHFESISLFSHCFFREVCRAPRFRPSTIREERRHRDRGTDCRGTASLASSEGPSTRTFNSELATPRPV